VERHLVNLFRKLEVRNRTELATRLGESGAKTTGIPR
jgi:DNA-binding NarL/FixJ family response regulator